MSTNTRTDPFVEAMTRAMSNREKWPILVPCRHGRGLLPGACAGHAACRAAYWTRRDAEDAAEADRERIELGGLRPKRRIRA